MRIKKLMDLLNKGEAPSDGGTESSEFTSSVSDLENEKVIYIDNARVETVSESDARHELLGSGTICSDQSMGDILVSRGKLNDADINRIVEYQREEGVYFGEAAIALKLVEHDDILKALSSQFGYSYGHDQNYSRDMVMAQSPFSEVAEEFRSIRAKLLNDWLSPSQKALAIISPGAQEGRSYFAANIALAFSQLGKSTLLIDADLRSPRQHEIFNINSRVGFSTLLAGRIKIKELDMLPDKVSAFPSLSVLCCGSVPPNPSELLFGGRFPSILRELKKYFEVIIIDSPAAVYRADVISILAVADSALLVARSGHTKMDDTKALKSIISDAKAEMVGAVLNQF